MCRILDRSLWLPLLWLALNLVDAQITIIALHYGLLEANPLMAVLTSGLTSGQLIVGKFVAAGVVLIGLYRFNLTRLLPALIIGMGLVVEWNLVWLWLASSRMDVVVPTVVTLVVVNTSALGLAITSRRRGR